MHSIALRYWCQYELLLLAPYEQTIIFKIILVTKILNPGTHSLQDDCIYVILIDL